MGFFSYGKNLSERYYKKRFLVASLPVGLSLIASTVYAYQFKAEEDGVIYPSNVYVKEKAIENNEYRTPEAFKMRYVPLGNDPKIDPLNQSYEDWLEEVRGQALLQGDIDKNYELFVKEIGPLLFSLGNNELAPEMKDLLANIPADSLNPVGSRFDPAGPIDVERAAEGTDPFGNRAPAEETILGQDVGLNISIKEPDPKSQELLAMAYDALKSGQMEGAVSIYEQILENDPDNKDAMFGLATTYHRMGQADEARANYIKLLSKDQNNWSALNNLMILAGEEAPEDALKELQELELINPEFSPIPAQIGLIYLRLNKIEESIKYFTRAIMLSPDNLAYRYNLAVTLDHAGYKTQAARLYKQLLDANKDGKDLPESAQRIAERLAFISSLPVAIK